MRARRRTVVFTITLLLLQLLSVFVPSAGADPRVAQRIAGPDRYATAVAVSRATWPTGSDVVFLAAAGDFADALSVGAVAAGYGPVLLADRDGLPPATAAELRRLAPTELVVVGGPRAISDAVMNAAARYARTTGRLAGPDRFATSVEVARHVEDASTVYVANGGSYQTAIVASIAAGKAEAPLVLVSTSEVPPVVERYLAEVQPERIVVVGDDRTVAPTVVNRLDRYVGTVERLAGAGHAATGAVVAKQDHRLSRTVLIATESAFPDALTGTALAVRSDTPLLFVQQDRVPVATACEIARLGATDITVLGGPVAVSDAVVQQLRSGAAAPAGACDQLFVPMTGAPLHEGVFDQAGNRFYVVNHQENQVEVVDAASGTHLRSIWVGSDPVDIDITKDGRYLYVSHLGSHDVLVVEIASGAWVGPRIRLARDPAKVESDRARAFTLAIDARDQVLFSDTQFGEEEGGAVWTVTHARWLAEHRTWNGDDEAYISADLADGVFSPELPDPALASRLVRSADRSSIGLVVANYIAPDLTECERLPTEASLGEDPDPSVRTREDCIAEKEAEASRAGLLIWDADSRSFGVYSREWGETVSNLAFDPSGDWVVVHGEGETTFVLRVADVFSDDRLALRGTVTSSAGAEGMAVHRDGRGCLVAWRLVDGEGDPVPAALEVLQLQQYDPNVGRCRDRYLPARGADGQPLVVGLDDSMAPDDPRLNEADLTRAQLVLSSDGARLAAMTEHGIRMLAPPLP